MNYTYISIFIRLICLIGILSINRITAHADDVAEECAHDRAALLALDREAFDQDPEGGWRPLADNKACERVAADLIAAWRKANLPDASQEEVRILHWHEGQLRAFSGDYVSARASFQKSHTLNPLQIHWNHYVDATLAFIDRDHDAFITALDTLKNMPEPFWWPQVQAEFRKKFDTDPEWPPNLNVVEGLLSCFEEDYRTAYSKACRRGDAEP